jgi:uncharacterized protein (TIGR02996 family)
MQTDNDFLAKLRADPADDTTRLVYSDWLDELGDEVSLAKAEFLRLTVEWAATPANGDTQSQRLQQLAARLDTDWLVVVSRLAIENCQGKGSQAGRISPYFSFVCDRRWEDLEPTSDQATRFCEGCRQNVHYCATIMEARQHAAEQHCIAVDLGVIRREHDLEPPHILVGRPSPAHLKQEAERLRPDPVSAERERRKREKERAGEGST